VGFPVKERPKTVGPVTQMGVELDSEEMVLRLPQEKLTKLKSLIAAWRKRKCCKKKELESLAGYLNHACKVVKPGRRFLRGLVCCHSSGDRITP
jgi:hypothetical protein